MNRLMQKLMSFIVAIIMVMTSVFSCTVISFADTTKDDLSVQLALESDKSLDDRGDFDGDGIITSNDASKLLDYVRNKKDYKGANYSPEMMKYMGDVNGDGNITAADVSEILSRALNGDFIYSGKKGNRPIEETTETTTEVTETTTKVAEATTEATETTTEVTETTTKVAETTTKVAEATTEATEATTEATEATETTTEATEATTEATEATTEATEATEATTEATETTTEAIVSGNPQDAVYAGYDIVVDARAESDANRAKQPIYKTVNEAVKAAGKGGTESDPVVIGIVPGVYREHIRVNAPYITFKKITNSTSTAEDATLTWYWLTTYTYDNIGADGNVDTSNPNTVENGSPNVDKMPNWGRSTWIQSGAVGFKAEGIYFENSANLYMTQEEKDVNVRPIEGSGKPERINLPVGNGTTKDTDVRASQWRERGCALYTEADKAQFINCKVISTQDTIGTSGRAYFKDCYLAGTVDFLCGGGEIVFDQCNIHWQASPYDGEDIGGALTAAKTDKYPANGYLFYNCKVTGQYNTEQVDLGRPWAGKTTETVWVNTISGISEANKKPYLAGDGWDSMGCEPELTRGYFEYNTKDINGNLIDTSTRRGTTDERFKGGVLDEFTVLKYNLYRYTAFKNAEDSSFDGWDPAGVVEKWQKIEKEAVVSIDESYSEDFVLPEAPEGYEVKYYLSSNFASIGEDGRTVKVTRPIYGQNDADLDIIAYIKVKGTIDGRELPLKTKILARTDSAGTFTAKGNVNITFAPEKDLTVTINPIMKNGFKPLGQPVEAVIKAGTNSVEYSIPNLPAAEYNLYITLSDDSYAIMGGDVKNIVGTASEDYQLDINIGNLETITKKAGDIIGTAASGYTLEKVTDSEKGEVYHYKRPKEGTDTSQKFYWDLAALIGEENMEDALNADKIEITFSVKTNATGGETNYIDVIGSDSKAFAFKADDTRYCRFRFGGGWHQADILNYNTDNWKDSSNNELQKLNLFEGAGKFLSEGKNTGWNDVVLTIDAKNQQILVESPQGVSSKMPFVFDGIAPSADLSKLKMMFYPTGANADSDTDEMYISKPTVSYQRFIKAADTSDAKAVSGTISDGFKTVSLVNKEQSMYKYTGTVTDGKVSFGDVPKGVYEVNYTLLDTHKFKAVTGTEVSEENGKFYVTVGENEITDLVITAEAITGFAEAEAAINSMLAKYTTSETTETDTIYNLKEALVPVSAQGYEITIKEGCPYVNTDYSLIIKKESEVSDTEAKELTFTIKNIGQDTTEDYSVKVNPFVISDRVAIFENFEDNAVNSTITTGNYKADVIKQTASDESEYGNVFVFANKASSDDSDKWKYAANALEMTGLDNNKIYEISMDVKKSEVTTSNNGWRINFGEFAGILWDGNKICLDKASISKAYTNDAVYGTTKDILTNSVADKWYNLSFICDIAKGNVDVFVDGAYVTSVTGAAGVAPTNIGFATHYLAVSKIYADNIKVIELSDEDEFKQAVDTDAALLEIPDTVSSEASITVPANLSALSSKFGYDVQWSTDSADLIKIEKDNSDYKVTFAKPTGNFTAKLIATAVCNDDILKGAPVDYKLSYTKEFVIKFVQDSSSGVKKYNIKISNQTDDENLVNVPITYSLYKGEELVQKATEGEYSYTDLESSSYKLNLSVGEDYAITEVKNGENTLSQNSDGSYSITLMSNMDIKVFIKAFSIDFDSVKTAINTALTNASKSVENNIYLIEKAVNMPTVEGYTISFAENDILNSNGTLKKPAYGSEKVSGELEFTIVHTESSKSTSYNVNAAVEPKASDVYEENFEGYAVDDKVNGGEVQESDAKGRYAHASYTVGNWKSSKFNMTEGKVYEVSFDIMRPVAYQGSGWKVQLGSACEVRFTNADGSAITPGGDIKSAYSDDKVYGTSKNLVDKAYINTWYNFKYICDTANDNVDVFVDGVYKTSMKAVNGNLPNQVILGSWYSGADKPDEICIDNISVKTIDNDFANDFDIAMAGKGLPNYEEKGVEDDFDLNLPVTTPNGRKITWSTDKESLITIGENGYVLFKKQDIANTAKLNAVVTNADSQYEKLSIPDPVRFEKSYTIYFKTTVSDLFNVSGDVNFEFAPDTDVDVTVNLSRGGVVAASDKVTVTAGSKKAQYSIKNVPIGTFDIKVSTNNEKYKAKDTLSVTGVAGDNKTVDITIGELETKAYTVDFESGDVVGTVINNDSKILSAEVVSDPDGLDTKVLKLTTTGDASNAGIYWNFGELFSEIANIDEVTVSYKIKANKSKYAQPIIDIGSGLTDKVQQGTSGAKDNIFVRAGYGDKFNQINWRDTHANFYLGYGKANFTAETNVSAVGSSNTNWYVNDLTINYSKEVMKGQISNGSSTDVALIDTETDTYNTKYKWGDKEEGFDGHHAFPTIANKGELTLAFYGNKGKIEYYMDDIVVSYIGFKSTSEPTENTYTVTGSISGTLGSNEITLVSNDNVYTATVDGSNISFANVAEGTYTITPNSTGVTIVSVSGTGVTESDGVYKISVNGDVSDFVIEVSDTAQTQLSINNSSVTVDNTNSNETASDNTNEKENADADVNSNADNAINEASDKGSNENLDDISDVVDKVIEDINNITNEILGNDSNEDAKDEDADVENADAGNKDNAIDENQQTDENVEETNEVVEEVVEETAE